MNKKVLLCALMAVCMIVVPAGTVFADEGTGDEVPEELLAGSISEEHPIVDLLALYFDKLLQFLGLEPEEPIEEPLEEPLEEPPADEQAEELLPDETVEEPILSPSGQIIGLFDDGLGFGGIVKLLSLAEAAAEACSEDGTYCDVNMESLLEELNASGGNFGALFNKYGKPDAVGIGHIRQQEKEPKSNNGKAQGKNK